MDIKDFYPVCINLEKRIDRWNESLKEFQYADISIDRCKAYEHENPVIGCAMSHFAVLRGTQLLDKHAMIFEDDIKFSSTISNLRTYLEQLDYIDWDMLYLGANITSPVYQINDYFARLTSAQSTHAYLVNKDFIPEILKLYGRVGKHMDLIYSEDVVPYHNCYITIPMLATQRKSYSDVEGRNVDYFWMQDRYDTHFVRKG